MSFIVTIKNTMPVVKQKDINRKFMYRYFASKANQLRETPVNNIQREGVVYEITRRDYERYLDNNFVVTGHLKWLIVGKKEDMTIMVDTANPNYEDGKEPITIPGVLTQNEASVMFLSRKLPPIKSYLRKYDQFYVGE